MVCESFQSFKQPHTDVIEYCDEQWAEHSLISLADSSLRA